MFFEEKQKCIWQKVFWLNKFLRCCQMVVQEGIYRPPCCPLSIHTSVWLLGFCHQVFQAPKHCLLYFCFDPKKIWSFSFKQKEKINNQNFPKKRNFTCVFFIPWLFRFWKAKSMSFIIDPDQTVVWIQVSKSVGSQTHHHSPHVEAYQANFVFFTKFFFRDRRGQNKKNSTSIPSPTWCTICILPAFSLNSAGVLMWKHMFLDLLNCGFETNWRIIPVPWTAPHALQLSGFF